MGWNYGAWGAGDWFAMSFVMLVFWGLLAALVVWLVRSSRNSATGLGTGSVTPRPDELLTGRFARGEIDADEFARRRALLQNNPSRT